MIQIDFLSLFVLEQILHGFTISTLPHTPHSLINLCDDSKVCMKGNRERSLFFKR